MPSCRTGLTSTLTVHSAGWNKTCNRNSTKNVIQSEPPARGDMSLSSENHCTSCKLEQSLQWEVLQSEPPPLRRYVPFLGETLCVQIGCARNQQGNLLVCMQSHRCSQSHQHDTASMGLDYSFMHHQQSFCIRHGDPSRAGKYHSTYPPQLLG